MLEAVCDLRRYAHLLYETRRFEPLERLRRVRGAPHRIDQQILCEFAPDHGRHAQDFERIRVEAVEPRANDRLHGVRDVQRLEAGGGDALAFTGGDGSLLEQRAAHLLEKERVAAAALVDATRQFVRDALYAENISHDRSGGFEVERHELNACGVRRPVDPPHPFGPGGDHDQQGVRGHDLEQPAQGFGGAFIRPVPVLQQQYTRRVPGERNQQRPQAPRTSTLATARRAYDAAAHSVSL